MATTCPPCCVPPTATAHRQIAVALSGELQRRGGRVFAGVVQPGPWPRHRQARSRQIIGDSACCGTPVRPGVLATIHDQQLLRRAGDAAVVSIDHAGGFLEHHCVWPLFSPRYADRRLRDHKSRPRWAPARRGPGGTSTTFTLAPKRAAIFCRCRRTRGGDGGLFSLRACLSSS